MATSEIDFAEAWIPQSCTLPAELRPLRVAEFDVLFTDAVRAVDRPARTRLNLKLAPTPAIASHAAGLVLRETACCSFFTFTLTASGGGLELVVGVPDSHVEVLDALAARVAEVRA